MCRVIDIADYIIQKRLDMKNPISNLALQKHLYFLQARFLLETGQPLFLEHMEKWKLGPVSPTVYHAYKDFGAKPIQKLSLHETLEINDDKIAFIQRPFDSNNIPDSVKEKIDESLNELIKFDEFELVEKTHEHSDWKKDEQRILNGERNIKYSNESIRKYFIENQDAVIW